MLKGLLVPRVLPDGTQDTPPMVPRLLPMVPRLLPNGTQITPNGTQWYPRVLPNGTPPSLLTYVGLRLAEYPGWQQPRLY